MRIEIQTTEGTFEGTVTHKDESFVFLRTDNGGDHVTVIHWMHVLDGGVSRIVKKQKTPLKIDEFKKVRE